MATKPKSAAAPVVADGEVTVVALSPIRHDGIDFGPGMRYTMSPDQAAALIAVGAAKAAE